MAGDDAGLSAATGRVASNLAWARRAAGCLFGREAASATLDDAWWATLNGQRHDVLIVGESGIGKTALAADFALRVHALGALVLYGRWDRDQIDPYQGFREALGTYADGCPTDQLRGPLDAHRDAMSRLLPDLAAHLGDRHAPAPGDPEGERLALYDAVHAWLVSLAAERPVLVVLDDLHWAERSSLLLIDYLQHRAGTAPWMLVMTCRASEGHTLDASDVERLELRGLTARAVARLAGYSLGTVLQPDEQAVAWLTSETAGNPLLVHHTLRSVSAAGDPVSALHEARDRLPEQLRDVIRWRLSQLPAPTRQVLTDAAILGAGVDLDLLGRATRRPPVLLRDALAPALDEELVRPDHTGDRYHFAHEVVRRTLGEAACPPHARHLHRQAARALEDRAAQGVEVHPGEIAHHYLLGVDRDTVGAAVRWARLGADAANRSAAFDEALQLLLRAVDVSDELGAGGDPEEAAASDALRCELSIELARAHDRASQFLARDERHLQAATMARALGRTDLFIEAALGYGGRLPAAPPRNPAARGLLEEALEYLPPEDSEERALVLSRLTHVRHFDAPYDLRRAWADEAVAMARRLGRPGVLATTLVARCLALEGSDSHVDEWLAASEEVIGIGARLQDADLRLQGVRLRVPALFALGRHREAHELAATYAQVARQIGHQDHLRLATLWDTLWAGLEGDDERVEATIDDLYRRLATAGHPQDESIRFVSTFVPRWLHGELERSRPLLQAFEAADPTAVVWWAVSAWLDAATGHEDRALARLDQRDPGIVGELPHDYARWPTLASLAVASSYGRPAWAAVLHATLLPQTGRLGITGHALFVGAIDHHLGTLALALDRPDEAVARLASALAEHRALHAPPFVGLTARWLAHALTIRGAPGDDERAAALLLETDGLVDRFQLAGLPVFRH
jgi:hypothetical protein